MSSGETPDRSGSTPPPSAPPRAPLDDMGYSDLPARPHRTAQSRFDWPLSPRFTLSLLFLAIFVGRLVWVSIDTNKELQDIANPTPKGSIDIASLELSGIVVHAQGLSYFMEDGRLDHIAALRALSEGRRYRCTVLRPAKHDAPGRIRDCVDTGVSPASVVWIAPETREGDIKPPAAGAASVDATDPNLGTLGSGGPARSLTADDGSMIQIRLGQFRAPAVSDGDGNIFTIADNTANVPSVSVTLGREYGDARGYINCRVADSGEHEVMKLERCIPGKVTLQ